MRLYLTSAVWNLSHKRFFTAASRLAHAFMAMWKALFTSLLNREFWKAILGPYESEAFSRGQQERQQIINAASE